MKCPKCGEEFEEGFEDVEVEEVEEKVEEEKEAEKAEELKETEEEEIEEAEKEEALIEETQLEARFQHLRRDRILFYTGIILIIVGGPGLAFGSWLHDWFRVPIIGERYDAFGWINEYFAIAGFIILIIGIILLSLSLRGGMVTEEEVRSLKSEG